MAALSAIDPVDSYFRRWWIQKGFLPQADFYTIIHQAVLSPEQLRDDRTSIFPKVIEYHLTQMIQVKRNTAIDTQQEIFDMSYVAI